MNLRCCIIHLFILFAMVTGTRAQVVDAPNPAAVVTDSKGETTELAFGDEYSGEAPLTVKFFANATEQEGFSLVCSWEFMKEGEVYRQAEAADT